MGNPSEREQRRLAALYCPDLLARLDAWEPPVREEREVDEESQDIKDRREVAREALLEWASWIYARVS